jgi:hypothetical protein
MTRKQWMLIALAVVLGGFSLYLNKDWFAKDDIHIFHRSRPMRAGFFRRSRPPAVDSDTDPVLFGFDRKLKLKSVKVVSLADLATNKYPHAIWHLISESNSVPTKEFSYGAPIPGMHPALKGVTADPLEPGAQYRLIIEADNHKAEHDFTAVARTP